MTAEVIIFACGILFGVILTVWLLWAFLRFGAPYEGSP